MSEEGKVGLGDEAKLSYQLDKKMESREVKGSVKIWELHSDVYRDNSSDSFCCLLSLPSRVHIYLVFAILSDQLQGKPSYGKIASPPCETQGFL